MLINEIISESFQVDAVTKVQDLLGRMMSTGRESIPTSEFLDELRAEGYSFTIPQVIQLVDKSGFASSVDADEIVPLNQLGNDVDQLDPEQDAEDFGDDAAAVGAAAVKDNAL